MVRTTVQELAAAVEEPPRQYVVAQEEEQGLLAADEMPEPIPLIDLSRLTTAAAADDEADKLRAALQTWGLFLVTNHGMEESLMDAMMSASRDFFRQPSEEKQKCSNLKLIDDGGKHSEVEGYGNDRVVNQAEGLSWNDRLHLRVEPEDERNFTKWPTHPESNLSDNVQRDLYEPGSQGGDECREREAFAGRVLCRGSRNGAGAGAWFAG